MVHICVCSSKRHYSIIKKTLTTLRKAGINTSPETDIVVNIVVPYEEIANYDEVLLSSPVSYRVIGSEKGLVKQRQTMRSLTPEGEKILFIDDDIDAIKVKAGDKLYPLKNILELADYAFSNLGDSLLWSVYPITNYLFMKHQISVGNCYCVGAFYGIINDPRLKEPEIDECEDFARQLAEQAAGRPPIRVDFVGLQTRYYKNSGGLQQARDMNVRVSIINTLEDSYPTIVKQFLKKGIPDLKFLQRSVKQPVPVQIDGITSQSTPAIPPSQSS